MNSYFKCILGKFDGTVERFRSEAMITRLSKHTVDTTNTVDMGWETGIEPKGKPWVIVEYYKNRKDAEKGHAKWVKILKNNPKKKLKDAISSEDWFYGRRPYDKDGK